MAPPARTPPLDRFIGQAELRHLISGAKIEDLGPDNLDLTSRYLVPKDRTCSAVITARQTGYLAGGALLPTLLSVYDPAIRLRPLILDGQQIEADTTIAELSGVLESILAMERVALNFMTHLSGVATATAQYVKAVAGTKVKIFDTRKTLPGLRALEKYAVACGGGHNHRHGLYDAVLVKDNHIAHLTSQELPMVLIDALNQARATAPAPAFIEVEVDTLEQLERVLGIASSGIDTVLLDNMTPGQLRRAVAIRDTLASGVELEVSGGIHLDTVAQVAATGVERISVGQITHSAASLDIALDMV